MFSFIIIHVGMRLVIWLSYRGLLSIVIVFGGVCYLFELLDAVVFHGFLGLYMGLL